MQLHSPQPLENTPSPGQSDLTPAPAFAISPVTDIVADLQAGKMVVLIDEEDRENEGDLVMAAQHISAEGINFMAKHGRGLICLTLTQELCQRLELSPMVASNGTRYGTAFTASIEAAEGVTTGISAADRAHTIRTAIAKDAQPHHIVQPGHVFPIQAVPGGVLMRAGHTEAGCDLAAMAGLTPAAVICEIMNDDGTMARLPELMVFAKAHGLKIGTIADLIEYRIQRESLIEKLQARPLQTAHGLFDLHVFRDHSTQNVHLALVKGSWAEGHVVPTRVHEPLSILDVLEQNRTLHAWSLEQALAYIEQEGQGVVLLLNCGESPAQLLAQINGQAVPSHGVQRDKIDLRTYGVGAQILRACGVHKMRLMGQPRRLPSVVGFGLEIVEFIPKAPSSD